MPYSTSCMSFRLPIYTIYYFVLMHLSSCTPRQSALDLNDVTFFDAAAADQILFLEFRVGFSKKGSQEEIGLVSAIAGKGRIKNLRRPVESPYQIRIVPRYSVSAMELPLVYQHPLFQEVEVPDPSGVIKRRKMYTKEGTFTMRMQADRNIEKLDIYSVTPERGEVKIYTLKLKR